MSGFMPVVFVVYAWMSLFFFSSLPKWAKAGGAVLLFLCSMKFQVYRFFGSNWISPKFPPAFSALLEISFNFLVVLCVLCFLRDVLFLGFALAHRFGFSDFASPLRGTPAIAILLVCSMLLAVFGWHEAVRVPDVKKVSLSVPGLPRMRIVHLSDLHVEKNLDPDWLSAIVAKVNGLKPDAVFITGDFADGFPEELADEIGPLGNLSAPAYGITGNHERYWNLEGWRTMLEGLGVKIMDGRRESLDIRGIPVEIAGIGDMEIEAAMPEETDILLVHRPARNDEFGKKAKLVLSGHTHGGQMFFLRPFAARLNGGHSSGFSGNSLTSPGTGLWRGMPIRVGVPAEITLVEIN